MKILARYLTALFLRNYFFALLGLTTLFVVQALMGDLFSSEYTVYANLFYRMMTVPDVVVQMTPPAVMMATVFSLASMVRSNELTACYSLGVGLPQILVVLLSLVFMICCFTLVLQDRIVPPVFRKRETFYWREMKKRPDFFLDVKQEKIWYRSGNLIYNLQTFDPQNNRIHGMVIYRFNDKFDLVQVIEGREAHHDASGWLLTDGVVTNVGKSEEFPITERFKERRMSIEETPNDFKEIEKEVDGLRLKEMYRYIRNIKKTGTDTKAYEVKFHSRVSLSFIPIIMCLLAVPFSVRGRREGGMGRDLGLCLLVSFFYWLFFSIGLSLGTNGTIAPWVGAWLPSFIFLGLIITMISYKRA